MNTIAIIDDDVYIGDMLEKVLAKEGFHVLRAYSGTEALLLLRHSWPELILLDLMLPDISGMEVLKAIRESSTVPIIILTAKDNDTDKSLGLNL